jgi:integrase
MPRFARKVRLTDLLVRRLKPRANGAFMVWDAHTRGLGVRVLPTGTRSWKYVYSRRGKSRWLHLGAVGAIDLAAARRLAAQAALEVAHGADPAAEKRARRLVDTFGELAARYVEEHAKKRNRSWRQADALVWHHLLPLWGSLPAGEITRADVRTMMRAIEAPVAANQTLAAASAIFTWAVNQEILDANPCRGVDRNPTVARERTLADSEIPEFWTLFGEAGIAGMALKMILLLGQRPGEVAHMRREHVVDGWWRLPGAPVPAVGWPGVKNGASHEVWLSAPARAILAEMGGNDEGYVFPGHRRGRPVSGLDAVMREICTKLGAERVVPHDLRRSFGTMVTRLSFGRAAMDRILNHREGGVGSIYDRHSYSAENQHVMEAVAAHIMALAEGRAADDKVLPFRPR